jgi:DNA polymerase III alpha subunit (gram-positive type)
MGRILVILKLTILVLGNSAGKVTIINNMPLDSQLLKNKLKDSKFIVFDFETESLSLTNARAWDMAWDVYHGTNRVERHQHYLNWKDLNVSKGAADATGFDKDKLALVRKDGKNPKDVIDLFNKYLYNTDYFIVGYNNLGYDSYVHNTQMLNVGYKTDYSFIYRSYDTLPIARCYRLNKKVPEDKADFLAWQYSYLNITLKNLKCKNFEVAKEFGYNVVEDQLHGAQYDISLTAFSFFNLIKKMDIQ